MNKQFLKENTVIALFFTGIATPIAWIFGAYYGNIFINALAMFLFLFIMGIIMRPIGEATHIDIISSTDSDTHIRFTAFDVEYFKIKTILGIGVFILAITIIVLANKIGVLITQSKHQVSPIDLIWCSPITFIYAYIVKQFKYLVAIQGNDIYFQNKNKEWRINFDEIQSYYVQTNTQYNGHHEWRISLKTGEHHFFVIPYNVHKHLRSWFMAHGMRAKQLKQ